MIISKKKIINKFQIHKIKIMNQRIINNKNKQYKILNLVIYHLYFLKLYNNTILLKIY